MPFGLLATIPLLAGVAPSSALHEAGVLVVQSVDQKLHRRCLDAKDYAGCVQSNGGKTSAFEVKLKFVKPNREGGAAESQDSERGERCTSDNVCVAKPGKDQLGLPKVVGWNYKYWPSSNVVQYWQTPLRRVPHKGQPDRYVALNYVEHYYQQPIAATPGRYVEITPKKKTCTPTYGGGIWVNGQWKPKPAGQTCTTTAATKSWVPGTPAVPGGPRSRSWVRVFDCKDKTKAQYVNGRLRGNWPSMNRGDQGFCSDRSELRVLNMKL